MFGVRKWDTSEWGKIQAKFTEKVLKQKLKLLVVFFLVTIFSKFKLLTKSYNQSFFVKRML